ncbi:hypothetical protein [Oceaniglobus ichthyenteri]|uniref:hypothetical protein n=1 Tax=Oceaniglobus ichthyenteri TaxID=2136177 RepID=UPI000F82DFFB|nr:hypothetical protein [Oceaniglobus ichthyenteri]
MTTAKAIGQDILDQISAAYHAKDFEAFAKVIDLPHTIITFEHTLTIKTKPDLHEVFRAVVRFMRQNNVTDGVRTCLAARFIAPDRIEATHETHFLSRGHRICPPYPSLLIYIRRDGQWKMQSANNAIDTQTGPLRFPQLHRFAKPPHTAG